MKNIVSEKWSLEKNLSSLIRRVIQLTSSAKFFDFCCLEKNLSSLLRREIQLTSSAKFFDFSC